MSTSSGGKGAGGRGKGGGKGESKPKGRGGRGRGGGGGGDGAKAPPKEGGRGKGAKQSEPAPGGRGKGAPKGADKKPKKPPQPKQHAPAKKSAKARAAEDAAAALRAAKAAAAAEAAAAADAAKAAEARRARERAAAEARVAAAAQAEADARAAVDDVAAALELRRARRAANAVGALAESRAAYDAGKKALKSDLKRSTALIKKIKGGVTGDMEAGLLGDITTLNLTRYVSELVDAVAETKKTKDRDAACAVAVCCGLHARHATFGPAVVAALEAVAVGDDGFGGALAAPAGGDDAEAKELAKHRKGALKLLVELFLAGFYDDEALLVKLARSCCGVGPRGKRRCPVDAALLGVFLKAGGEDLLGIVPRRAKELYGRAGLAAGPARGDAVVGGETTKTLRDLATAAHALLAAQLATDHAALAKLEAKSTKDALTHGALTEEKEKALDDARKAREKLLAHVVALGDCLDLDAPALPDFEESDDEEALASLSLWGGEKLNLSAGPFDDETQRSFYEDYPNVLDILPAPLLGYSEADVGRLQQERLDARALWKGASLAAIEDGAAAPAADEEKPDDEPGDEPAEGDAPLADEPEEKNAGDVVGRLLSEDLPACYNRERADAVARAFCEGHGTKNARRRLARALFAVPRTASELVPQYARVAAVVCGAYKDVGTLLVSELLREFRWLQRKKSQHNLETKIRNARLVGELVKFRVAAPHAAFACLRACLEDFSHHAVDVACCLLEVAGGFLLRSPPTSQRAAQCLDAVMKLKRAKPLNARDAALVDNAYYACCPPERAAKAPKPRSELYGYVRWLFFDRLAGTAGKRNESRQARVDVVIRELRRLPWGERETGPLVAKHCLKMVRSKADAVPLAADCLAGLHQHRPHATTLVLDAVCAAFDAGVDAPPRSRPRRTAQRLVAYARFFGECYNFALVSGSAVFATLHRLIRRGHDVEDPFRAAMAARAAMAFYGARARAEDAAAEAAMAEGDEDDEDDDDEAADADPERAGRDAARKWAVHEHARHDPRVPCDGDGPGDFLRVHLACAILDAVAPCLVAVASGHAQLEAFLDDLQRYFYAKPAAPLGARYALLDAFDAVDAHAKALVTAHAAACRKAKRENKPPPPRVARRAFKLRADWAAADDAVVARETAFAAHVANKKRRDGLRAAPSEAAEEEDATEGERRVEAADDGERGGDGGEAEAAAADDSGDDDDEADDDDDDDEEEEEDDGDDEEDDDDAADDPDFERRDEKSPEDLDFERALSATMADAMAAGRRQPAASAAAADNMATPSMLRRFESPPKMLSRGGGGGSGPIAFKMLKRGARGKLEARDLFVPTETNFASQVLKNAAAREREARELKASTYHLASRQDDD